MRFSGVHLVSGAFVGCALAWAGGARGDVFHLNHGAVIDGEVIAEDGERYTVRVVHGVVTVPKGEIARRESRPPPWERYEAEREKYPATAAGHYELAMWCRALKMSRQMKEELRLALERDPDYEPARRALGFVRKNGQWVEAPQKGSKRRSPEEQARREEEKLVRQIITNWFVRVRAIRSGRFDGPGREEGTGLFRDGRAQVLAIKDPLAIPALTGVLSAGNEATRRVLVEALARFPQDEATMNLLVMSVFDPSPDVRMAAAVELIRRKDERIVGRLREALHSSEEQVLRNAAVVLGVLRAQEAVEDLIPLLETKTRGLVSVPRTVYFNGVLRTFHRPTILTVDGRTLVYLPHELGVLTYGSAVGTVWTTEVQTISVFRTEVQEALIRISGQNLGFDRNAWRAWWRHRQQGE